MINNKIPVIVLVGPTASGKTDLSIAVAKHFNGEIVSADSMQIYKGMPIASAAPTCSQQKEVKHHLVEFLDNEESFSVADYVSAASKVILDIHSRGKLPVVVGGTGLYIDSLINNIIFSAEKSDSEFTDAISKRFEMLGGEKMLEILAEFDRQTALRLHPNDKKRIIRAFEVYERNGYSITKQNELSAMQESPYKPIFIGITFEDRDKLYDRINKRVDLMLEEGLLEEARSFSEKGKTARQAIGHKEFLPYFNGEISFEQATENLKRETRRYAKRQLTWFRRNKNIIWLYRDCCDISEKAFEIISKELNKDAQ